MFLFLFLFLGTLWYFLSMVRFGQPKQAAEEGKEALVPEQLGSFLSTAY